MAGAPAGASVDDARALRCPAEHIGAGIDRMPEDLQHGVISCRPPRNPADAEIASRDRQLQRCILRPKQDLPSAAELLELVEQEPDDPADPPIAGREDELQFAPQ